MNAAEASKLTAEARNVAEMPFIYKQIREAAESGLNEIFLPKFSISKQQIEQLRTMDYWIFDKHSKVYSRFGYATDDEPPLEFVGWRVTWSEHEK